MSKKKLILLGIDGCDFKIINPLIKDGYLPTFSEILRDGCHTTLMSTLPPNTLPAWTSIFTGVNPGKHGITDFVIRENGRCRIANSNYRMVESLWAILSRWNKEQIIINEPVTYPPEKIKGIMLTGFSTPLQNRNFAHPSSIIPEVNKVCNGYEPELPFGFEKVIAEDKDKGFKLISRFAEKTFNAAKYLSKNYSWDLLSIFFTSTDRLQHYYFLDSKYIRAHYQLLDRFIDEIVNLESEANIIVVSDHGFGPLYKCFYVNTWLRDQNLVTENKSILNVSFSRLGLTYKKLVSALTRVKLYEFLSSITPMSIRRRIPANAHDGTVDFSRSAIFSMSLNGGLFINDPNFDNTQVTSLMKKLSSLTVNGEKPIEHVYSRKDAVWGAYASRTADIYLMPRYGYEVSHRLVRSFLAAPSDFGDIRTGTHGPWGIFAAYGPDISKGVKLKESLFTWDIAPIILHTLDLPIPGHMDGYVKREMFKKGSEPAVRPIILEHPSEQRQISQRLERLKSEMP